MSGLLRKTHCQGVPEMYEGTVQRTMLFDVFAELLCITDLDNFIKRVTYNGIRKTCGDITYRSAFLLRLLNLGVHKYRTTCTEINRLC